eukprot:9021478-Alexandrium_andersonii.AAC.1
MSASLVGSEMCIRDSSLASASTHSATAGNGDAFTASEALIHSRRIDAREARCAWLPKALPGQMLSTRMRQAL